MDIDAETFNLDPAQGEQAITPRTKAIMPVHLYGQVCDMEQLEAIAETHRIAIIEDAIKTNRPFFNRMKELTVTGYFTSEIGATEALAYLPIPGRFDGDVPLEPGQKAWAISR